MNTSVSYLITCSNEKQSLSNLLNSIELALEDTKNEMVVVLDSDCKDNQDTKQILFNHRGNDSWYYTHSLNNDYSEHKNWGSKLCKNPWIFQIDGDELPTDTLLWNVTNIIDSNPDIEAFWIPRINDFIGVNEIHAKQWGWRLTPSTSIIHERVIDTNSEEYKFLKNNGYILEETKI